MHTGQLLSQRYKLLNILGSGGMSQAYLAEDRQRPSNPQCVVKKLQPLSPNPKLMAIARSLFHREAVVLEQLGAHDQIPCLLAHFEENQEFYLVEEFVEGYTLATELQPGMQWSEAKVIHFLLEILPVLEFIHSQNVIHRDIKPDNIIRRARDGRLVLIDFGAVRQVQADLTASNPALAATIVGTYGYMPTEQAYGHPSFNSDLYAVGMICIQALTGLMLSQIKVDSQTGELQWSESVSVSREFATVLSTMVRSHSQERYPNATEALKAVKNIQTQLRPAPVPAQAPSPSPKLQGLRKSMSLVGVGLAAAVGVVLIGHQLLNAVSQKPLGTFGGDRVLDIGVVAFPRANSKGAYDDLSAYLKTKLQERLGQNVSVKLHIISTSENNALERAKQNIKSRKWELAFTSVPMLSVAAKANNYRFAARMSPERSQGESVLFVRKDSPIQSLDDLTPDKTIALANFSSAAGFYMPVYDLYGKTLKVDMNNGPRDGMEKVRSGLADVAASANIPLLKEATDLRVLHTSRAIPRASVYLAPTLTSQDQTLVSDLLLAAPSTIQEKARYGSGKPVDYSEFLKIVKRVEKVTSCSNWQATLVKFYCDTASISTNNNPSSSGQNDIVGTTNGYRAFDNRIEFTLQSDDRKTYRLVLPRTVLDSDPKLDSPGALNFKKVTIKAIKPIETDGVPAELRITAPGQLEVLS
jgi:ABC-type phosphate/phosphonate transport system substrate-binding protein